MGVAKQTGTIPAKYRVFGINTLAGQFDDTKTESLVLGRIYRRIPMRHSSWWFSGCCRGTIPIPVCSKVPKRAALDGYTGDFGDELYDWRTYFQKAMEPGKVLGIQIKSSVPTTYSKITKDEDFTIDGPPIRSASLRHAYWRLGPPSRPMALDRIPRRTDQPYTVRCQGSRPGILKGCLMGFALGVPSPP